MRLLWFGLQVVEVLEYQTDLDVALAHVALVNGSVKWAFVSALEVAP